MRRIGAPQRGHGHDDRDGAGGGGSGVAADAAARACSPHRFCGRPHYRTDEKVAFRSRVRRASRRTLVNVLFQKDLAAIVPFDNG